MILQSTTELANLEKIVFKFKTQVVILFKINVLYAKRFF